MIHHAKDVCDTISTNTASGYARPGKVCTVSVPLSLTERSIWFGVVPYGMPDPPAWLSTGTLRFFVADSEVGRFAFEWANNRAAVNSAYPKVGTRPITGGDLPMLRIESISNAEAIKYFDLAGYRFSVEADRIEVWSDLVGGGAAYVWAGYLEVLSQSP